MSWFRLTHQPGFAFAGDRNGLNPMQKTLAVIVMAASLTACGAVAGQAADPYPAQAPQSAVAQGSVLASGVVTFSGHGFKPGERISITIAAPGLQGGPAGGSGAARSVGLLIPSLETITITDGRCHRLVHC